MRTHPTQPSSPCVCYSTVCFYRRPILSVNVSLVNIWLILINTAPNGCIDYLITNGKIELKALTYIRGRSIPKQFIIYDESQNLSPHVIKTILTRVGRGSKIVFTGDPEQIDHPYLDASSNGLSYLAEKIKGEEISGHITLIKGERSGIAELGARLL
jgi:PhoH-like ATPase